MSAESQNGSACVCLSLQWNRSCLFMADMQQYVEEQQLAHPKLGQNQELAEDVTKQAGALQLFCNLGLV